MGEKAMVLFSGGIDSTTCLALAIEKYGKENVIPLSVFYGQKHEKEVEAARNILEYYGIKGMEIDLTSIFAYSNCSLLTHSQEEIPEASYGEQLAQTGGAPVSTYVPFRNGLFLSCAASLALSLDCQVIYYGAHMDDAAGNAYPDCSGKALRIEAPFINQNKAQIVARGLELKAPYQFAWNCYEGKERPCGVCGTCTDRRKAFEANGIKDPALGE